MHRLQLCASQQARIMDLPSSPLNFPSDTQQPQSSRRNASPRPAGGAFEQEGIDFQTLIN